MLWDVLCVSVWSCGSEPVELPAHGGAFRCVQGFVFSYHGGRDADARISEKSVSHLFISLLYNLNHICSQQVPVLVLFFMLLLFFFNFQQKISWSSVATCSEGLSTPKSLLCTNMWSLSETSSPWIMVRFVTHSVKQVFFGKRFYFSLVPFPTSA